MCLLPLRLNQTRLNLLPVEQRSRFRAEFLPAPYFFDTSTTVTTNFSKRTGCYDQISRVISTASYRHKIQCIQLLGGFFIVESSSCYTMPKPQGCSIIAIEMVNVSHIGSQPSPPSAAEYAYGFPAPCEYG